MGYLISISYEKQVIIGYWSTEKNPSLLDMGY